MSYDTSGFSPMKLGYRNTRCRWGTHIACLYQSEEERDRLTSGYLCRGLHDGDFLYYCPAEQGIPHFRKTLIENCPDFRLYIDDPDRIRIISAGEVFYPKGHFSRNDMNKTLSQVYERQHREHHRNIRVATEMTWALEGVTDSEDVMEYEEELNILIHNRSIVVICLYNLNKFSNELIMRVLKTHPYTISKGILTQSSYYKPPTHYMNINEDNSHSYQHAPGV